jgi:hypothetical protein
LAAANPAERASIAAQAALTRWARQDHREQAIKGQAGLYARFLREVDPEGTLPEDERHRRAQRLRRAHMLRLGRLAAARKRARVPCTGCGSPERQDALADGLCELCRSPIEVEPR